MRELLGPAEPSDGNLREHLAALRVVQRFHRARALDGAQRDRVHSDAVGGRLARKRERERGQRTVRGGECHAGLGRHALGGRRDHVHDAAVVALAHRRDHRAAPEERARPDGCPSRAAIHGSVASLRAAAGASEQFTRMSTGPSTVSTRWCASRTAPASLELHGTAAVVPAEEADEAIEAHRVGVDEGDLRAVLEERANDCERGVARGSGHDRCLSLDAHAGPYSNSSGAARRSPT